MAVYIHCGCECNVLGGCSNCSEEDNEDICLDCNQ